MTAVFGMNAGVKAPPRRETIITAPSDSQGNEVEGTAVSQSVSGAGGIRQVTERVSDCLTD